MKIELGILHLYTKDNVYSAVTMAEPLQELTQFMWWLQHGIKWTPTFEPNQPMWSCPHDHYLWTLWTHHNNIIMCYDDDYGTLLEY